jgi:prolipoprotein diacylglyceryl transferase
VIDLLASIPSPETGVWYLGPVPLRGYALIILLGMFFGTLLTDRRWRRRGGRAGTVYDVALWAIPFGIIGARLYHVLTDWQLYFAHGGSGVVGAVTIWHGGLGIWGAVAGGVLGAWIACRRRGLPLAHLADAAAPGLVLAQAIGRWGNYLNQELFGRPTDAPWGLQIDLAQRPPGYEQYDTFHPTFLYESLWCLVVLGVLLLVDRHWRIGYGRLFALYVALYCAGRVVIESLRIDAVNHILGMRLNIVTSIVIGLLAVAYFLISLRRNPGRPEYREPDPDGPEAGDPAGTDDGLPADEEAADGAVISAAPDDR